MMLEKQSTVKEQRQKTKEKGKTLGKMKEEQLNRNQ